MGNEGGAGLLTCHSSAAEPPDRRIAGSPLPERMGNEGGAGLLTAILPPPGRRIAASPHCRIAGSPLPKRMKIVRDIALAPT
jgi:hypothetical protein